MSLAAERVARTLHFSVDPSVIVVPPREMVLAGEFSQAVRFIMECLDGIDYDSVTQILAGTHALAATADGCMDLVEDDGTLYPEYTDMLDWKFGALFQYAGRFYRPYAYVTRLGSEDWEWALELEGPTDNVLIAPSRMEASGDEPALLPHQHLADIRALYYARSQDLVAPAIYMGEHGPVRHMTLFAAGPVAGEIPPHMLQAARTRSLQQAVDAAVSSQRLCKLGAPEAETFASPMIHVRDYKRFAEIYGFFGAVPDAIKRVEAKLVQMQQHAFLAATAKGAAPSAPDSMRSAMELALDTMKKADDPHFMEVCRKNIIEQAGDDWMTIETTDGSLRVPTAPFLNWIYRPLLPGAGHLCRPWNTVTPRGLRIFGSNPYHTDWMIGANVDLALWDDQVFQSDIMKVYVDLHDQYRLDRQRLVDKNAADDKKSVSAKNEDPAGVPFRVLEGGSGRISGLRVVECQSATDFRLEEAEQALRSAPGALVIPSADPRFLPAAVHARVVITQRGGRLGHLVSVLRDASIPVILVENAFDHLHGYPLVRIDFSPLTLYPYV